MWSSGVRAAKERTAPLTMPLLLLLLLPLLLLLLHLDPVQCLVDVDATEMLEADLMHQKTYHDQWVRACGCDLLQVQQLHWMSTLMFAPMLLTYAIDADN